VPSRPKTVEASFGNLFGDQDASHRQFPIVAGRP
jgi:hypothetical protein